MKTALHTIGMFALGAVCLLAMGTAFTRRVTQPLPVTPPFRAVGTVGGGTPRAIAINTALRGVSQTLTAAADRLTARQDGAAPLLDAAWRVSQVIAYAGARAEHRQLETQIESARRSLQNGDGALAATWARSAGRIADTAAPAAIPAVLATTATYHGAVVLDVSGNRLGTIADVDRDRVVIETPGLRHVLGFITVQHGHREALPRNAVLFGEPRTIGETLVVSAVRPPLDSGA